MKKLLAIAAMALFIGSCINPDDYDFDNIKNATWSPNVGFPMVKSVLDAQNLMGVTDSSVVTTDQDGLIVLQYQAPERIFSAAEFLYFENDFTPDLPATPIVPGNIDLIIPFPTSGVIDAIRLQSGNLQLELNSGQGLVANYEFIHIKKPDGNNLVVQVPLNSSVNVDLSGHVIRPNNKRQIEVRITIPSGASGMATPIFDFTGLEYASVVGDFSGVKSDVPSDSIRLNIFKNLTKEGRLTLENPTLELDIVNGFGFPFKLDLSRFYSYNKLSNDKHYVFGTNQGVYNVSGGSKNQPVETKVVIGKGNSKLPAVVEPTPNYLFQSMSVEAGNGGAASDSIENGAAIRIAAKLNLPLAGSISGLVISDTVNSSFSASFDQIKEMAVRTYIKNGFPFEVNLTLQLLDDNYAPLLTESGNPVYLMDNEPIFVGGEVDAIGRVDQSTVVPHQSEHLLDEEETRVLLQGKYIRIYGTIETTGAGSRLVRVYDDYKLDIKAGVRVVGNITIAGS